MQNPDRVRSKEDALRDGINCVSLAHLALREVFDYELPSHLAFAELCLDRIHFASVESVNDARLGDLFWFGVQHAAKRPEDIVLHYNNKNELINWQEFPVKHVALHTGVGDPTDPLLLHATFIGGGRNAIWPLSKFCHYRRYKKLYGISRLVTSI